MAKSFTPEEIEILKKNKYTAYVDEKVLRLTAAFKIAFMELYRQGVPPRKILPDLGYDLEIIGKSRLNGISQQIRRQAESDTGFHQGGVGKRTLEETSPEEKAALTDRQLINRLQGEVIYLRQELEFIKKLHIGESEPDFGNCVIRQVQ